MVDNMDDNTVRSKRDTRHQDRQMSIREKREQQEEDNIDEEERRRRNIDKVY